MTLVALLLPLVAFVIAPPAFANISLLGITSVEIQIAPLPPLVSEIGLSEDEIRTDVELRLRQTGIDIRPNAHAILHVEISLLAHSGYPTIHFRSITTSLLQYVILVRNRDAKETTRPLAVTWTASSTGYSGRDASKEGIRRIVRDQVDRFLNDYLKVNPKK